MSQENVAVVRGYYEALTRVLDGYAGDGASLEGSPFVDELFAHVHPDAEWQSFFRPEPFRGREDWFSGAADWLEAVDDWSSELEEVIEAGDLAVAILRIRLMGKESGVPVDQRMFVVAGVRDGLIVRLEDHTDRGAAFAAAGLAE